MRGPIVEEPGVAAPLRWMVQPESQTEVKQGIEITTTYASSHYLAQLFSNEQIFGNFAGLNPFFSEQLVFYVKIANRSGQRIGFEPSDFVLVDDRGNQYVSLSTDYATALAEAKAPVGTLTRGVLEDARPGYFGLGLPVGKLMGKPQRQFTLLKMSELQAGFLHDGVVYDGLISFWSPHREAKRGKLLLLMKTEYNAEDKPRAAVEFPFEFLLSQPARTRRD